MDEFSFPTVPVEQDPLSQLPFPLWFVSSTAHHRRRSFSSAEEAAEIANALKMASSALSEDGGDRFLNDENRMDMLWEDFNEELRRMSSDRKSRAANGEASSNSSSMTGSETDSRRHGLADLPGIHALDASKSGSLIHHRRPTLLLMLKVLKKLFLIQKSSSSKRKPLN